MGEFLGSVETSGEIPMASEEVVEESARESESPTDIMKFLCSYGGKILPRPFDGNLKYVGGEIRVVAVPRGITFSELMKRLRSFINGGGEMVLKYQIIPEDLDELVTVKSDEDLKHMIEEHERQESQGVPKLRTFLFPLNPVTLFGNQAGAPVNPLTVEQRYIDAINGVHTPTSSGRPSFSISACSSPKSNCHSPKGIGHDLVPGEAVFSNGYQMKRVSSVSSMHRVQSSPSIYGLSSQPQQHFHQNHALHQPRGCGYGSFRPSPPPEFSRKGEYFSGRVASGHDQNPYFSPRGGRIGIFEDGYGNAAIDRASGIPRSPRKHGLRQ